MKHILCFGDSNTFGSNPLGGRHPWEVRYPGKLQQALGPQYRIIEEGMGGRTTVFEDEIEPGRNGSAVLPMLLTSHRPLDLVVIMLGTNDLKARFQLTPWDLGKAMEHLLSMVANHPYGPGYPTPQALVVSPILIGEDIEQSPFGCFTKESAAKSKCFSQVYAQAAQNANAHFMDASLYAGPSREDQLHMDQAGHADLAVALERKIREILG